LVCGCSSAPPLPLSYRRWGDDIDGVGVPPQPAVDGGGGSGHVEARQLELGALPGLSLPAVETATTPM
jgi:hypothetical protein